MSVKAVSLALSLLLTLAGTGCFASDGIEVSTPSNGTEAEAVYKGDFTVDTPISDVMADPDFEDFGRLLFPVQKSYYGGNTLGQLTLAWYSHIDPNETVEIVNTLKGRALAGQTVFYDIYTDEEKAADPSKEDTGLFFSRVRRESPLPFAAPEGASPMWEPCTTASPTRWSYPKRDITPLP